MLPPIEHVLFEALRCRRGAGRVREAGKSPFGSFVFDLLSYILLQAADTEAEMESLKFDLEVPK